MTAAIHSLWHVPVALVVEPTSASTLSRLTHTCMYAASTVSTFNSVLAAVRVSRWTLCCKLGRFSLGEYMRNYPSIQQLATAVAYPV